MLYRVVLTSDVQADTPLAAALETRNTVLRNASDLFFDVFAAAKFPGGRFIARVATDANGGGKVIPLPKED
jgi:hypothetical protein